MTKGYHNLLQKEEKTAVQTYLWDGNVAGMWEDTGASAERMSGRPAVASHYYLQDDLGSPIRLFGEGGGLEESYGYDEFGQDLYGNQGLLQPFGYTGYQADRTAGTYYAQAREYRAELGRFAAVNVMPGDALNPLTQNRYKYCLNQPFHYIDPTGCLEEDSKDNSERDLYEKMEGGLYGFFISGIQVSEAIMVTSLKKDVVNRAIASGGWSEKATAELDELTRTFGATEDDVVRGFANTEAKGLIPIALDALAYTGAFIDAGEGIEENINAGAPWQKTVSDAAIDLTLSGGSIWASSIVGAKVGASAGGIAGAVVGLVISAILYGVTDMAEIDGKTVREHMKDGDGALFWGCGIVGWKIALENQG